MSIESRPGELSRHDQLLWLVEHEPEKVTDLDASMLLLELKTEGAGTKFPEVMRALAKKRPDAAFDLIFALDDPDFGKTKDEKVAVLRYMKAMLEKREMKKIIRSISVKGKSGEEMIEPNVFSSGVVFIAE